ncbi:toll/interleukin-1 receptor domain-containing protein [Endothiovibrio diazotrophicus]
MESGKPTVKFFVSYAHDDKRPKERLLERLKVRLKADPDFAYELWDDGEIVLGERWSDAIRDALSACDFGLLLVSYRFLTSEFIGDRELAPLLADGKALPVGLDRVALDGSADLKGLEELQIARDKKGRFFSRLKDECARDDFIEELFLSLRAAVTKRIAERPAVLRGAAAASSANRPLPPDSPFLETIQTRIRKELERELLAGLVEALLPDGLGEEPAASAAHRLVRELPEVGAVQVLSDAARECLPSLRERERALAAEGIRTALGWLLLRCVSEAWLAVHGRQFEGTKLQLELPTETHLGVELVVARSGERPAKIRTDPQSPGVYGLNGLSSCISEWGIEPQFGVDQLKCAVWKAVFCGGRPPDHFGEWEDKTLNAELGALARIGEPYYFTIPRGDDLDAQRELFRRLLRDLSNLSAIFIGTGEGEALLVNEYTAQAEVRRLLLFLDTTLHHPES